VLVTELSMPLLLAPVGYLRVMHPDGEIAAAGRLAVQEAASLGPQFGAPDSKM